MSIRSTSSVRRATERFARFTGSSAWRSRLLALLGSTWTLGLLAAVATWNIAFTPPLVGLDPSWAAGLYMAAHRGLHFGTQIIFTYGPLGFLNQSWLWYQNLAAIAFVYQAALHIALSVALVWALRRTLHPALALVATFVVLVTAPSMDVPLALSAVCCLAALSPTPSFSSWLVVFGGAGLGATESLVELRSGPVILVMCALTLLADRRWRLKLPIFLGLAAIVFALLWFGAGQGVDNFPEFVSRSWQVVSGYGEAMSITASPALYRIGELLLGIALVVAAAAMSAPGRARVAATAIVALAAFALFKEAAIRAEFGHTSIFYGTAAGLAAAMAWSASGEPSTTGGNRRRVATVATLGVIAVIAAINVHIDDLAGLPVNYNPVTHARQTSSQVRLLLDPARRNLETDFFFLIRMTQIYRLAPGTLDLLRGHTVDSDPWEAGVAWTYGLNWDPLPVLQDYSAYTSTLDRLDADALRAASGPQRVLRENTTLVDPTHPAPGFDGRFAAWDPPEKSLAMLCNYLPLQTTARWQVLGKVPDRCGTPRLIRSIHARYGTTVTLPVAAGGEVVYANIDGVSVSGLERIRTLLYRAESRHIVVNGRAVYRLVPGTAGDGLLMDAGPAIDYPAPFALSPSAHTIRLSGGSGALRVDLYSMPVRPARRGGVRRLSSR